MRRKKWCAILLAGVLAVAGLAVPGAAGPAEAAEWAEEVTLRISNWEEYIDLGDWDEDETIDLDSGDIIGNWPMIDEFEDWYYRTYGVIVHVEYSTFGTNEDLYNMLTLGDVFDLVCPSEYMVMKLMAEDALVPLSDEFFDTSDPYNYYSRGSLLLSGISLMSRRSTGRAGASTWPAICGGSPGSSTTRRK